MRKTIAGTVKQPPTVEQFFRGLNESIALSKLSPREAGEYILAKHAQHLNAYEAYCDLKKVGLCIQQLRDANFAPEEISLFEPGHQLLRLRLAGAQGDA